MADKLACAQCATKLEFGKASRSMRALGPSALLVTMAETLGWQKAAGHWFCARCAERGKATEHNPDYVTSAEHPRCDRLGRPLLTLEEFKRLNKDDPTHG